MSKQRKKNKKQPKPSLIKDIKVTKDFFDKFSEVARKTLKVLELEPELYDKFTKKQKLKLMQAKGAEPHFQAKNGHHVPRHYIAYVQKESYTFLKLMKVGNPEVQLSFYDFMTMGMLFCYRAGYEVNTATDTNLDIYRTIDDRIRDRESQLLFPYFCILRFAFQNISQFNYRIYGFELVWRELKDRLRFAAHINIMATPCEKIYFEYNNKKRPAFRMMAGNYMYDDVFKLSIPNNKIYPKSGNESLLNVYIQSHALQRMKERLDTMHLGELNFELITSVTDAIIIKLETGHSAIAMTNHNGDLIAYLPYIIQDQNLIILTILPTTAPSTPTGKKLCELLNINKKELEFCGMDKLSYFTDTDFDQLPTLKEAIKASGLWHLTGQTSMIAPEYTKERHCGISKHVFENQPQEIDFN